MEIKYIISFIILGIIILFFYVTLLVGFFALYYFRKNINKNIKLDRQENEESAYFIHTLYIAIFFIFPIIIVAFYQKVLIGLLIMGICLVLIIVTNFLVKINMKNIVKITFHKGIRPPLISIKFKKNLLNFSVPDKFKAPNKNLKYYEQDKNYKISETNIDSTFDYQNIMLNDLIENKIMCIGIKKGKNFVEISYFNGNYIFRIYLNEKEEEICCENKDKVIKELKEYVNKI